MKKILYSFLPILAVLVFAGVPSVSMGQNANNGLQDELGKVRKSRQDFKDARAREMNEATQAAKEKTQAQREVIRQRKEEAQQEMEQKRKEVLLRLVGIQVSYLERVKERVNRMPNITDELKSQLGTEIDAAIQELEAKEMEVNSVSGREEIKEMAKEIRDLFRAKREIVKNIVDAIHASRANNIVAKAEERMAAVKARVGEMKEDGKDTTELEEGIEEIEDDIASARDAVGRKAFREANEDLKGAYQKFRNLAAKARGLQ